MNVSRRIVIGWLETKQHRDNRGWKSGTGRKYTKDIADHICALKKNRIEQKKYFLGSEHVRMDYHKAYPKDDLPSLWYIDEVVRNEGLQTRQPRKKKQKGGSEYLLYPKECIRRLKGVHQSADFVGKKYITGQTEPIHIFSSAYYTPFKLLKIARITAEKSDYAIEQLADQWQMFPIPNVFRMDNGLQFRGSAYHERSVGKFLKFLLNLDITPLFGAPSKPWTNPHVEGHNRVFNDKIWSRHVFANEKQIDAACAAFNAESLEYFEWRYKELMQQRFRYLRNQKIVADHLASVKNKKIYFIRFVESFDQDTDARIVILNETILLPEKYGHQFVFVQWDLEKELLNIFSEYQGRISWIMKRTFKLNL